MITLITIRTLPDGSVQTRVHSTTPGFETATATADDFEQAISDVVSGLADVADKVANPPLPEPVIELIQAPAAADAPINEPPAENPDPV